MKKTILMMVAALFVFIAVNAQTRKVTPQIRKSGNPALVIKGKTVPIRKSTNTKVQPSKNTASKKTSYQREMEESNYKYWREQSDEYNINKNIEKYFSEWLEKGEFEKTSDYDKRLNERSKTVFDSICNMVIISKIEHTWRDIELGTYNTETEEFPIFVKTPYNSGQREIGKAQIKVPIEIAQDFRNKFYSGDGTGFNYSIGPVVPRADFVYVSSTEHLGDNVLCPATVCYFHDYYWNDTINIKLTYDEKTKPVKVVFDELGITDKYLNGHVFTFDGYDENIYEKEMVDKMPSPYGYESIEKWIEQDSQCQEAIKDEEYRVLVRFVIDKNGRMNMLYSDAGEFNRNILYERFESIKKWSPGILNGKRVNTRVRLYINYKSESKKKNVIKEEQNESESNKIFNGDDVDQQPSFPGGTNALNTFIVSNLKYPVFAQEKGIQGRVVVKFIVEKDGSISNVEVDRSVNPGLDNEAMRVVKAMPKWIPGQINGKAVKVECSHPFVFRLQ